LSATPADRRAAAGDPAPGEAEGTRGARAVRLVLPEPGRLARAARALGADREGGHQVRQAVRRPEAAPVHRAGPGRNPEVVFLDELTAGLDPGARHATWDLIAQIRDSGVTV